MAVAASREGGVLLSVDRADTDTMLKAAHPTDGDARPRPCGLAARRPEGLRTKRQLALWVRRGVDHVRSLTPK